MAFALAPEAPLDEWFGGLDDWTANSPGFFAGRPVVLDLNLLKPNDAEIAELVAEFSRRGIRIYAIDEAGREDLDPSLPPLLKGARPVTVDVPRADDKPAPEPEAVVTEEPEDLEAANTLILDQPVRSGQSIYHPEGDIVVLGSVASGSEVIAGGSVHIYGTLRGRAFAGANGKEDARIFCRRNEAELLSVDGWYRTAEDMEATHIGRPIQAYLEGGVVCVTTLN
ncbi:septum site-determining protein MinC [Tianweitania sediminis]|uniref:Probable septum site-determining protein MinC n=1 Tax=Tianweitania sediminis TaxID=1502156 RepID=A0A8J7R0B7_9HYPH|nr:septum site-determining protein MinC [Tianweitania sediminis]MBP0437596.1 septum site-determining protein MinC [Tianweitania sediminis]